MGDINLAELEEEFNQEVSGYGSLSISVVSSADESEKLGYYIRPEDIEALYFDGIGTPRWESIQADNVDEQLKMYNKKMNSIMEDYPLISRVKDTDASVDFEAEEVVTLLAECKKVIESSSNEKATRATRKFSIACEKAINKQAALILNPC